MKCLKHMQYDGIGIGEKEVSAGLSEVDIYLKGNELTGLNANIIDEATGLPHFTPYKIVQAGDLKVGITSILGGDAVIARTIKEREEIRVDDPITTGRAMLETLRDKKVDLAVLIAHTGLQKGELLVDSLSGFDVILIGHGGRAMNVPTKENGVILASPGSRSNQLGYVTLVVENRTVTNFDGKSWQLQQDDGPRDEFVQELAWGHLKLNEKGVRIKETKPKEDGKLKTGNVEEEAVPTQSYLGNDNCRMCHADIFETYQETPHANAFQVIAESESDWQNPKCWNCHTLGFGEPTGHSEEELQPDLWNVQCESCHGMGTEHVRGQGMAKLTEASCTNCHVEEWSPDFDYRKALSRVVHKSTRSWN